jgi:sugar phosphate isomerase/epimerase
MGQTTRRHFLKNTALGIAAASWVKAEASPRRDIPVAKEAKRHPPFSLGLASYTFREFSLEDTISMTKRVGLEKITLKSMHLPLESSKAAITAAAERVRNAGLDLYGCGVVYMTNAAEVEQAFAYARTAKMRIIIGVPNPELLGLVNQKVKDYNIKLAIHNHGPDDKLYPTPESAYKKIKNLDFRLGLCIDIGHTMRSGVDPADAAIKFADRLLDVHIKDVTARSKEGQTAEMGRGIIDIPEFSRALIKINYQGTVAFEYEKDGKDPLPGLAESVGYLRGILAVI